MKKFFVVVMGVALCLAFAASAFAIDEASLESQTSEYLYDRTDPYDLAQQPGLLYKLDRWRLYTNLSGYEADDSYVIGTTGKLGPGSLAFFYETTRSERDERETDTSYDYYEYTTGTFPNYDGTNDYFWDDSDYTRSQREREENNFYAAYSMDFDRFSLGLSYAPELLDRKRTVETDGSDPDLFAAPAAWDSEWFYDTWNIFPGSNSGWGSSSLDYHDQAHSTYDSTTTSESFTGKQKGDITVHPIKVQSSIHTADNWHLLVGLGYATREEEDDVSSCFKYNYRDEDTSTGYVWTEDSEIRVNGSLEEDYDGDEWGLSLEPVVELNDMVTLRADVEYSSQDADLKGGRVGTLNRTWTFRPTSADDTRTRTWDETWDGSGTGDFEGTDWSIEPRVYLTFDKVRFSLGLGYRYSDEEWDGRAKADKNVTYTYDDGDGAADADDQLLVGSWTGYETFDGEEETTTWRFPVATEFDVTDKLTFRAGAAYYRVRVEEEENSREVCRENENWTWTDGTGAIVAVGPDAYYETAASNPVPYDADSAGETHTWKSDRTYDFTTYHLGLGYMFTENLKFDLMYTGSSGGVDMTTAYASVTISF